MNTLIAYFAQRGFLARLLTMMVMSLGIAALFVVRMQENPELAYPEVDILTEYPGASPQEIETKVTNRIEKELRTVDSIREMVSESTQGRSSIALVIEDGADIAMVVRNIQQAVDRVTDLPVGMDGRPLVLQESTSSFEVLRFGITTEGDMAQLNRYARQLEKRLRAISGVGSVALIGYQEREFWIALDPNKAKQFGISFETLSRAIEQRNVSLSGGMVTASNSQHRVITHTPINELAQIEQLIVKRLPNGVQVRVSDIASVTDRFAHASEYGMVNGQNAILVKVAKTASVDVRNVIEQVLATLKAEKVRTNGQFDFHTTLDMAKDMGDKFNIVASNGAIGLVLILGLLGWALQKRIAFWVSMSIPFCLFGVIAMLPALGMTLDSLTLAALLLVIGIIVDDSVIVAESVFAQRERGVNRLDASIIGTAKVSKPILASLVTTVLVFIPMLFLPGEAGLEVVVIPMTVICALLFSWLECTFLLPAHLVGAIHQPRLSSAPIQRNRLAALTESYHRALMRALRHKFALIVGALIAVSYGVMLLTQLRIDFYPTHAAKYIRVSSQVAPGTPISDVRTTHLALEQAIAALPQQELVGFEMRYATPESDGMIVLTNAQQRDRSADEIARELNVKLQHITTLPWVTLSVDAGGPPPGEPVELRVIGQDASARNQAVTEVVAWLKQQPGLSHVTHNEMLKEQQLAIVPDHDWLSRYQMTVSDLAQVVRLAFDGDKVTTTWLGDEEVGLRLILAAEHRTMAMIGSMKVPTANGEIVPLSRLARAELVDSERSILHYQGERTVLISAQIEQPDLMADEVAQAAFDALSARMPNNVRLQLGGEAEATEESLGAMLLAIPAAVLAIYLVLAVMFGSLLQPLLVVSVIPFAFVTSLLALPLHLQPLSMFALVGALGMCGVVVNNALMMIVTINKKRVSGIAIETAVLLGATERFRPIVLTSLTTIAGLLPLAYGLGGADVNMGPMALTLGYGLLFSVPVVLFLLPCLYLAVGRQSSQWDANKPDASSSVSNAIERAA